MATARWLTEDEQQTWRAFVRMTHTVMGSLDRQLQRDARLPHGYYVLLVKLSEAPDRSIRMTELAETLSWSQSRMSHAVDRLVKDGHVVRMPCPTDRRGSFAILTDAGFETLQRAAPGHVDEVRRTMFDNLTPTEQRQLRRIAERIVAGAAER